MQNFFEALTTTPQLGFARGQLAHRLAMPGFRVLSVETKKAAWFAACAMLSKFLRSRFLALHLISFSIS